MIVSEIRTFDKSKSFVVATQDGQNWVLPALDASNLYNLPECISIISDSEGPTASDPIGLYFNTENGRITYNNGTSVQDISRALQVNNTQSVQMTYAGGVLTADVKISNANGNQLSQTTSGLYVPGANLNGYVQSGALDNMVEFTDLATAAKAGVVKVDGSSGLAVDLDDGTISVKYGTGLGLNAQGELIVTGTGNVDYATMREQLGINELSSQITGKIGSAVASAIVSDISRDGASAVVTMLDGTTSSLSLPKISSGEYIESSTTIRLTDTDGDNVDINMSAAIAAAAHTHANKMTLDRIGEDQSGRMTYNGNTIGGLQQFSTQITSADDSAVTWMSDIANITHNMGTVSVINVLLQNEVGSDVIAYDNYGYYTVDSNSVRIAVPGSYDLSSGTWTVTLTAMA